MDDVILTTPRLRLRRLSRDDAPHVVSACQTPGFTDGMSWEPVASIEESHEFTDYALGMWDKGEKFVWTVEAKDDSSFIGRVEVGKVPEQPGNVWELGYWIHPMQQGKGYATEAAQEALRYAFEDLKVDSVLSSHHDWNDASGKVLRKIGMRQTGFSEGRTFKHGKPVRAAEFWLDRSEWTSNSA